MTAQKNRLWNTQNPAQTSAIRVLSVCSAGMLRSPTIANILVQRGYNARSCGCATDHALIPIDAVLVLWADWIIVVDQSSLDAVLSYRVPQPTRVFNFDIPDCYQWMEWELQEIISDRINNLGIHEVDHYK